MFKLIGGLVVYGLAIYGAVCIWKKNRKKLNFRDGGMDL